MGKDGTPLGEGASIEAAEKEITAKALKLGMQQPDETQLRVVNLSGLTDSTTAQSADSSGAGEMMD